MVQLNFCAYCRSHITTDKRICHPCFLDYYDDVRPARPHELSNAIMDQWAPVLERLGNQ